ncbi:MAG: hypothetical protein IPL49_17090 [Saprospirales bacterium]|nr:hypothetical protein [Saprospirales bacterium]MBK8492551.1 hypothetical protein [Saprospirales bacterium]
MFYLLQLEWLKQRKNRSFLMLGALYFILLPCSLLIAKSIQQWPPPINTSDTFFRFPDVFIYLGYVGNWLTFLLLGFLSVLFITQEFSSRTFRQNVITGLTRADMFWSKVYFMTAVSLAATLYYGLVAMVLGVIHSDALYTSVIMKHIDYIPRFFVMCMGYMSVGLLLGVWIRRTGFALFSYFSYALFIEPILRWGVHQNLFKHQSMHYYPMNAFEDLAPVPFSEMTKGFEKEFGFQFFLSPQQAMITSVIYIALFLVATYLLITRRDL